MPDSARRSQNIDGKTTMTGSEGPETMGGECFSNADFCGEWVQGSHFCGSRKVPDFFCLVLLLMVTKSHKDFREFKGEKA